MRTYRLPNGNFTKSTDRYVTAWRKLSDGVVKALNEKGWSLYAFDPDIALRNEDGRKFECPIWLARKLMELSNGA